MVYSFEINGLSVKTGDLICAYLMETTATPPPAPPGRYGPKNATNV